MSQPTVLEGNLVASQDQSFALIASRFNHFIVDQLVLGAIDALRRRGADPAKITVIKVPGAWELPIAAQKAASTGKFDAVVALGAVIRGSTPHFDYVAAEATKGLASVSMQTGVPIAFGVLTTDTIEQAIERAGTKAGNKGGEAAESVIEMVNLFASLDAS